MSRAYRYIGKGSGAIAEPYDEARVAFAEGDARHVAACLREGGFVFRERDRRGVMREFWPRRVTGV